MCWYSIRRRVTSDSQARRKWGCASANSRARQFPDRCGSSARCWKWAARTGVWWAKKPISAQVREGGVERGGYHGGGGGHGAAGVRDPGAEVSGCLGGNCLEKNLRHVRAE